MKQQGSITPRTTATSAAATAAAKSGLGTVKHTKSAAPSSRSVGAKISTTVAACSRRKRLGTWQKVTTMLVLLWFWILYQVSERIQQSTHVGDTKFVVTTTNQQQQRQQQQDSNKNQQQQLHEEPAVVAGAGAGAVLLMPFKGKVSTKDHHVTATATTTTTALKQQQKQQQQQKETKSQDANPPPPLLNREKSFSTGNHSVLPRDGKAKTHTRQENLQNSTKISPAAVQHNSTITMSSIQQQQRERKKTIETWTMTTQNRFFERYKNGELDQTIVPVQPLKQEQQQQQQQQQRSNDARTTKITNEKPTFILHIGPSKTATSTIQRHCIQMKDFLALDNYIYLGKFSGIRSKIHNTIMDPKCFAQVQESKLKHHDGGGGDDHHHHPNTTNRTTHLPSCWQEMIQEFNHYRLAGQSLIVSDEKYSYNELWGKDVDADGADADGAAVVKERKIYDNPLYFQELHNLLSNDWNVIIVAGYRRYADWIWSAIKQMNSKTCTGNGLVPKPKQKKLMWPSKGGQACSPPWKLFRSYTQENTKYNGARFYRYIDNSIPVWKAQGFQTKILNLHSNDHHDDHHHNELLMVRFYCHILPKAPNTCFGVQREIQTYKNGLNVNDGELFPYHVIVFDAAVKGILDPIHNHGRDENIMIKSTRWDVAWQLYTYHQKVGKKKLSDLPLLCPPRQELQVLLNKTIQLENQLLSFGLSFSDERTATNTTTTSLSIKEDLRKSFWSMVYQFCMVDTEVVLQNITNWEQLKHRIIQSTFPPPRDVTTF